MGNHKIGIRRVNVEKILLAAEKVFAEKGYGSTAMADIAEQAQLPRSNLHYYFSTKSELYSAVLFDLLEVWKQDALCFEMFDDPRVVLSSYIRAKMQHSRSRPYGSKVWANEIIHGAPSLGLALDVVFAEKVMGGAHRAFPQCTQHRVVTRASLSNSHGG